MIKVNNTIPLQHFKATKSPKNINNETYQARQLSEIKESLASQSLSQASKAYQISFNGYKGLSEEESKALILDILKLKNPKSLESNELEQTNERLDTLMPLKELGKLSFYKSIDKNDLTKCRSALLEDYKATLTTENSGQSSEKVTTKAQKLNLLKDNELTFAQFAANVIDKTTKAAFSSEEFNTLTNILKIELEKKNALPANFTDQLIYKIAHISGKEIEKPLLTDLPNGDKFKIFSKIFFMPFRNPLDLANIDTTKKRVQQVENFLSDNDVQLNISKQTLNSFRNAYIDKGISITDKDLSVVYFETELLNASSKFNLSNIAFDRLLSVLSAEAELTKEGDNPGQLDEKLISTVCQKSEKLSRSVSEASCGFNECKTRVNVSVRMPETLKQLMNAQAQEFTDSSINLFSKVNEAQTMQRFQKLENFYNQANWTISMLPATTSRLKQELGIEEEALSTDTVKLGVVAAKLIGFAEKNNLSEEQFDSVVDIFHAENFYQGAINPQVMGCILGEIESLTMSKPPSMTNKAMSTEQAESPLTKTLDPQRFEVMKNLLIAEDPEIGHYVEPNPLTDNNIKKTVERLEIIDSFLAKLKEDGYSLAIEKDDLSQMRHIAVPINNTISDEALGETVFATSLLKTTIRNGLGDDKFSKLLNFISLEAQADGKIDFNSLKKVINKPNDYLVEPQISSYKNVTDAELAKMPTILKAIKVIKPETELHFADTISTESGDLKLKPSAEIRLQKLANFYNDQPWTIQRSYYDQDLTKIDHQAYSYKEGITNKMVDFAEFATLMLNFAEETSLTDQEFEQTLGFLSKDIQFNNGKDKNHSYVTIPEIKSSITQAVKTLVPYQSFISEEAKEIADNPTLPETVNKEKQLTKSDKTQMLTTLLKQPISKDTEKAVLDRFDKIIEYIDTHHWALKLDEQTFHLAKNKDTPTFSVLSDEQIKEMYFAATILKIAEDTHLTDEELDKTLKLMDLDHTLSGSINTNNIFILMNSAKNIYHNPDNPLKA